MHPDFALLVSRQRHRELVAAAEEFHRARRAGRPRRARPAPSGPARPRRGTKETDP